MSLSQPSRTIVVEPVQAPKSAPVPAEPSRQVEASRRETETPAKT